MKKIVLIFSLLPSVVYAQSSASDRISNTLGKCIVQLETSIDEIKDLKTKLSDIQNKNIELENKLKELEKK